MMLLFGFNLVLAIIWAAVTGNASLLNLGFGFVLSAGALYVLREQMGGRGYLARIRRILRLTLLFLRELMLSAFRVAVLVLRRDMRLKPGIVAFPLTVTSDVEITLLANLITLTPGTLSVDVSADRRFLYVHALDLADPEAVIRDIRDGFEAEIREVFQ